MEQDLISIVVPVYNAERFLTETIQTVMNQTIHNWELILIDDCSTDGSYELLESYKNEKIHVYRMPHNSGQAMVRNYGRGKARGRYLAYLDADDLWSEDKLEIEYNFMREHGHAFVFHGYEFAGEDGVRNGKVVHVPKEVDYDYLLRKTVISTITVMFDREQIPEGLLVMPSGVRGEDTATWWQILRNGYTAYGIDMPLSVYRRYGNSHSSNKLRAVWGTYKMYRNCEGFSAAKSWYYFVQQVWNSIMRRL